MGDLRAADLELFANGGFEQELAPAWVRRTPSDKPCRAERASHGARTGQGCLVLENQRPAFNRVRQGADRRLVIAPGSLVELSAWVKSELSTPGWAGVQLYCMGRGDTILAQPAFRARASVVGWQRVQLIASVPPGTEYCMVYLQADQAPGKAWFDDVRLEVVADPRSVPALAKVALITDLGPDDECLKNVRTLLADNVSVVGPDRGAAACDGCDAAVVLLRDASLAPAAAEGLGNLARRGGRVFMDLRAWARWQGLDTQREPLASGAASDHKATAVARQMAIGLRVVQASPITSGFTAGQIVPYAGPEGQLLALAHTPLPSGLETLAVTPSGKPALVRMALGRGQLVAADVLSLAEPHYSKINAYYKYLFLANTLTGAGSFGCAEFYPHKLTYAGLVDHMREMARRWPALRLVDEGAACAPYRMYSLNLGRPGKPLYFLYAAAHGSEWEPGYGLLSFAKQVAQGRLAGVVDLDRVAIKIIPILNPAGYDRVGRQNAHGVDLNRQGDHTWNEFQGRDSNRDGRYGPGDYDWKGMAAFCEPEAQVYRRIAEDKSLYCVLDFHGNASATSNKVGVLPDTAAADNPRRAFELQWRVNQALRRRYVLHQADEPQASAYLLDRVYPGGPMPFLMNTAARDRYGLLVELTAGYADSYGTVLQTEATSAICRALFEAYPIPSR
jgi:hypothetical protein